jgi:putative membrane protein
MDIRSSVKLYLKGMAMGAADVVPGVSGGTIAFISGIYQELLGSIRNIGPDTYTVLRTRGIAAAWRQMNGTFLAVLVAGIGTSVVLLARPISWLLEHQPVLIWSFFFGLIAASVPVCGRKVRQWQAAPIVGLLAGAGMAVYVGMSRTAESPDALWFFFLAGAIAICAMILPGISGSFILLLMGAYAPILAALKGFEAGVLAVFFLGCITGLMAFSRLLHWMYRRHHDLTVATLTGFLLGSLTVVWPWKEIIEVRLSKAGTPDEHHVPLLRRNVLPDAYRELSTNDVLVGLTNKEPMLLGAIALAIIGAALLLWLDRLGPDKR